MSQYEEPVLISRDKVLKVLEENNINFIFDKDTEKLTLILGGPEMPRRTLELKDPVLKKFVMGIAHRTKVPARLFFV